MPGAGEVGARAPGGVERERQIEALDETVAVDHREVVVEFEAAVRLRPEHAAMRGLDQVAAEGVAVLAPGEVVSVREIVVRVEFELGAGGVEVGGDCHGGPVEFPVLGAGCQRSRCDEREHEEAHEDEVTTEVACSDTVLSRPP